MKKKNLEVKEPAPMSAKELSLKVGSPREKYLNELKEGLQTGIENARKEIDVNTLFIERLEKEIEIERKNFK